MSDVSKQFRNAMAHLGAAVNVITTDGPGGRAGITATAVCSVTDTPPTLLVCVNRNSSIYPFLNENKRLCVNVLGGHQELIGKHFAGMTGVNGDDRFAVEGMSFGTEQQPRLAGALAVLEGSIVQMQDIGTHTIMFVELDYIEVAETGDSLVYFSRLFHRVPRSLPVVS